MSNGLPLTLGAIALLSAAGLARGGSRNASGGSPAFDAWFRDSVVRNPDGTPRVVIHQTSWDAADRIAAQGFRLDLPLARKSDEQMPDGIFLKTHANPIGVVRGNARQIPLHARLLRPLRVHDRSELERWLRRDPAWLRIKDRIDTLNRDAHEEVEACFKARAALGRSNGDESHDRAIRAAQKRWNDTLDAWSAEIDALNTKARARVTERLRSEGYDGLWMTNDEGTQGRKTETIVVLDPSQVRFTGPHREFGIGEL